MGILISSFLALHYDFESLHAIYHWVRKTCILFIRDKIPTAGLETIQQRRGQQTEKPILLTGPGKVE